MLNEVVDHPAVSSHRPRRRSAAWEQFPPQEPVEWTQDRIGRRFERLAATNPYAIACIDGSGMSTYGELNARANALARHLLALRGDREEPVAVLVEQCSPALVGILGVLKAGKIVTPLDATWPADRLAWMLRDSGAPIVIALEQHAALARELAGPSRAVLTLESVDGAPALENSPQAFDSNRLAYLLYTSGSTGTPKGIVHSHRTALHNIENYSTLLELQSGDRLTWLHSPSFSAAWIDILCALMNGASLCAWNVKTQGVVGLADWLNRHAVTVVNWAPSPLRRLIESMHGTDGLATPRLLMLGSEAVLRSDWESYCRFFPDQCRMVNRLGATEVNNYRLNILDKLTVLEGPSVPGGFAVPGKEVSIVTESGALAPIGEVGQIVVRSRYCSPGYWNRPDLTERAFRPDPADPLARYYQTGDLGRLRPDGNLEFHGRSDFQVKIRGHRIEISEIENALNQIESISEAAVVARPTPAGEPQLVAYVVSGGRHLDLAALRDTLRARLPDYMIPSRVVTLPRLPTTETGKIDRKSLPKPPPERRAPSCRDAAPRNVIEEQLLLIWRSVLERQAIGIRDDFFALGGDSLRGITLFARIESIFGVRLPLETLIKDSTIERLSALIDVPDRDSPEAPVVVLRPGAGRLPLFAVPSAGGKLLFWQTMFPYLDPALPVLGLRLPCSDDRIQSFESIAEYFVGQVNLAQPEGPVHLVGYSFSGRLAYELARQLTLSGREVAFVGLIDCRARSRFAPRTLRQRVPLIPWFFRNIPFWLADDIRRSRPRSLLKRVHRTLHQAAETCVGPRCAQRLAPPHEARSTNQQLNRRHDQCVRASGQYFPPPYAGRVTLLRARSHELFSPDEHDFGWGRVAGEVEVRVVGRCRHSSMLNEPFVAEVTRSLQAALDASATSQRREPFGGVQQSEATVPPARL